MTAHIFIITALKEDHSQGGREGCRIMEDWLHNVGQALPPLVFPSQWEGRKMGH